MPQARPIQTNFTGGELSPLLYGRVDTAKYQNGARQVENFIVMPHGGVKKRPGSKFVGRVKTHAETGRLRRFQYNVEQAYMLFFGPSYIRFYTPGGSIVTQAAQNITGITKANPAVVTYAGSDTYANGDRVIISGVAGMTEVNGREFTVANVNAGANTFELSGIDSSSYTAYSSGGTVAEILEVTTTYTEAELPDLGFAQSNDVLYIAHPDHALAKLVRTSALVWTLSNETILRGPWRGLNVDQTITLKANNYEGAGITVEASSSFFDALHVGAKFKVFTPGQAKGETDVANGGSDTPSVGDIWANEEKVYQVTDANNTGNLQRFTPPTHLTGTVRQYLSGQTGNYYDAKFIHKGFGIFTVTARASATSVTATVYTGYGYLELPRQLVDPAMAGGVASNSRYKEPTSLWQEGAWSDYRGYPSVVTLFEQRLMAANNGSQTQTIWGSVSGNLADFEEGSDDDRALNYTIGSEEADVIRWMMPGKQLLVGTISGEYVLSSNSLNDAVTPGNIRVSRETKYGSSKAQPVRVANSVIFVQRQGDPDNHGKKLREMAYDYQSDSYQSAELTIWSEHITGSGVKELAYQAEPDSLIWGARTDGYMCACTFQHEQEVVAWHKHFLGGYSDSDSLVPPVIESIDTLPGTNGDELWMIVKRYVNGATVRYVELLSYYDRDTAKEDMLFLDCAISYAGASATTLTGLHHLVGQSVHVLGNGAKMGPFTVSATGTITLTKAVTEAFIGLKYKAKLRTMDLEAGARGGTAQGLAKRVTKCFVRFDRSLGGSFGHDEDSTLDPILFRTTADDFGTSPPLFTGDKILPIPKGWERDASVYIETDDPYPMTIVAIGPEVTATG